MEQETILKIEQSIKNLESKSARIYFLVQDTKGNAKAGIRFIYQMAKSLKDNGFNPIILHETQAYQGVAEWMGAEYMEIPHNAIENQNLQISPEDIVVIPEIYGHVMEQISKLPCGKIVLCQAYDHMLETLQPGETWSQFGFFKCITTSEIQKEFIENVFRGISYEILKPYISDIFEKQSLPPKPIVAIHSRDQRDAVNIIKSFYIKFPQYRWITFRDMRGLSEKEFANGLKDCFLSVWVDDTSAYGTFPLESMKVGVPVLGLVPNLVPTWMNEDNGLWINNQIQLVDFIADFLQNWLEDNVNPELYKGMEKTVSELPTKENFETLSVSLFEQFLNTRMESFLEQLSKLITIEE